MRVPASLTVDLTSQCNLRCRYCYFFSHDWESGRGDAPKETWLKLIADAGSCGVMRIGFRGGEALLRPDLPELLTAVVKARMRFSLLTNGILLTDELVEFIKNTRRCDTVKLSLDGDEASHDAVRGKGSHAAALRAIEKLQRAGVPVTVTCAVHKQNFRKVAEFGEYFFKELELPCASFSAVRSCSEGKQWELTPEEFAVAMLQVGELMRRYPERMRRRGMAGVWCYLHEVEAGHSNCGRFCYCSGSGMDLKVRSDGSYVACDELGDQPFGKVEECSILEAWEKSAAFRERLGRSTVDQQQFEACRSCRFAASCRGDCPGYWPGKPELSPVCLAGFLRRTGLEKLPPLS